MRIAASCGLGLGTSPEAVPDAKFQEPKHRIKGAFPGRLLR